MVITTTDGFDHEVSVTSAQLGIALTAFERGQITLDNHLSVKPSAIEAVDGVPFVECKSVRIMHARLVLDAASYIVDQVREDRRMDIDKLIEERRTRAQQKRERFKAERCYEVTLQWASREGGETEEVPCLLPIGLIAKGVILEIWVKTDLIGVEIDEVVISTYWPEDIKVVLSTNDLDDATVALMKESLKEGLQP